jgi:hypothetical protein
MSDSGLSVEAPLGYWPVQKGDITNLEPRIYDMRTPEAYAHVGIAQRMTAIQDARVESANLGLEYSGFELLEQPSAVGDWFDTDEVMNTYYEECKSLACKVTGAEHVFTYDHLIREPGKQTSGGGLDGSTHVSGVETGGGYIGAVHMDYTANTTWTEYLALHGKRAPTNPRRVLALNFWRPISDVADGDPLALCDARTVRAEDLVETVVYGYGAENYSWHDIGIPTYNVKASSRHRWYYYPCMSPSELLVLKSYDSDGVIGGTCPHASFVNPLASPDSPPRKSIELRVLCFVGGEL